MKRFFFLTLAMLMASGSIVAQSSNNVDEVVKIDRHAARDYREGEMIVKFKETSPVRMKAVGKKLTSGVSKLDQVFNELGIETGEQLMPLTGAVKVKRATPLKSITGKTITDADMTQLYRFKFDAKKMSVHQAANKLKALEEVEYAEPNYIVYALSSDNGALYHHDDHDHYCKEPLYTEQWGHHPLKMPFLWQQPKLSDRRPVIAILDTGVDIEHPDLKDNIWTNTAELDGAEEEDDDNNGFADDIHGYDFVNQTPRIGDWNGHGTHCAGIAAAVGKNGIGVTGANPDALIMPVTVMQSDGTGDVATIIKGIDYAAANGADVISMSIGGYGYSFAEEQALAKAYSKAVLVAAAGNDGHDMDGHHCYLDAPMFPAAFTFVLGVEASTSVGQRASFSNYDCDGPVFSTFNEEQLYNYELRAPGSQIMSTYPGGKYKKLNGTSMACPFVAGGVSRLLQVKEYSNWEILFGDLIHTRKQNGYGDVDFEAAYKISDADRKPSLGLVTYILKDTIEGDGDGKPDAGETIAFYPTLRNEWGQAKNIRFSLELAETEDPTILEFLDEEADFGKSLSSYGKNKSANPIRFKVNPECVDGRKICMALRATCDNIAEELVQEFTLTAENGVEIGGMITADMTLYPNVHYIVTKPLAVPEGVTLTIKPGTVLKFKDNTGLSCAGTINCIGKPDSMIVFTKADLENSIVSKFRFTNPIKYTKFSHLSSYSPFGVSADEQFFHGEYENCIFEYCTSYYPYFFSESNLYNCNIFNNIAFGSGLWFENGYQGDLMTKFVETNICSNSTSKSLLLDYNAHAPQSLFFTNIYDNKDQEKNKYNLTMYRDVPLIIKFGAPSYLGSNNEDIIREGVFDMYHKKNPTGFAMIDLSDRLNRPSAKTHGIVWKVVVNGYDAQDEFEHLPPLGVGKHKYEVFFNRPMDTSVAPMIAMGVRPPYKSHTIAEEGSWNEDGTIYTAYLTITGKTNADGLNRIYVANAVESSDYYYINKELQQVLTKTEALFKEIVNIPGFVTLQSGNPSDDGYISLSSGSSPNSLIDGDNSSSFYIYPDDNIQIDLGKTKATRFIRFNTITLSSSVYNSTLEWVTISGSNDGENYNIILKDSLIENKFNYKSNIIDAGNPYRYYRFGLHAPYYTSNFVTMTEFALEALDAKIKEEYASLVSEEDIIEYQKNTALAYQECQNVAILQSALDKSYAFYNKLAEILGYPAIEQQPVNIPSTPDWVIPVENMRFNVQVAAAGSMATGLMAEAGLGKVNLTWQTDEEDFADLLGYNIYRYTDKVDSVYVEWDETGNWVGQWKVVGDTTIINPSVLEASETSYTDYDVVPGTTYYYVIKQLTTSLNSHALSNAVAATPLTAQKGDANGSMKVDIADVVTEVSYITYQEPQPFIFEAADVNSDEKVNVLDVVGTIGIISTPAAAGINSADNEPIRYYVEKGVLYVETAQALGGVQVRLHADKGTEITAMEALNGMEQTSVWTSDSEYLFLAYSMSGRTIAPGTHALLKIGDETLITEIVVSDVKGRNVEAISGDATGIETVKIASLNIPNPNPFTTHLNIPYIIGASGSHEVVFTFSDLAGRVVDTYQTVSTQGEHCYTWRPAALQRGMYFVTLYVDGKLVQSSKVVCNK